MTPRRLLVLRLSALGDVAMTVPVLRNVLAQHPQLNVTVVSSAFAAPLFQNIERLHFHPADLKGRHKGLAGLYRLSRELKAHTGFEAIADLHDVLRTKVLRNFFRFSGTLLSVIDKGRKEKKELTRLQNKKLRPLRSTFQRYADVLNGLGLPVELNLHAGIGPKPAMPSRLIGFKNKGYRLVGIAPFAAYPEKTYPAKKMQEVVRLLCADEGTVVLLFGGKADKEVLAAWESERVLNWAGTGLAEELAAIAHLDVMVSMDSANMHLASLYGVPVISVWGGTHPYLGFMGWGQRMDNAVQIDLPCRPSSVFGSKPCPNNCACLEGISTLMIYEKVAAQLNSIPA